MSEKHLYKNKIVVHLSILLSAVTYYWLCYETERENFYEVLGLYSFLFAAYYFLNRSFWASHFNYLLIAGVLFRMLLLFSVPNLSDDVYRFIWDGRLMANGFNPYDLLPAHVIQLPPITGITKDLYQQLNSPSYYTIYPPVLQAIFWFTAKLFPTNVFGAIVCLKVIILFAETGTILLLPLVLRRLQMSRHLSLLYALNPLVIAELTGNVHFDAVMIFFVIGAFLLLLQNKIYLSAIFLGLSISTKIIPVLFIPLLIKKLGWKQGLTYAAISVVVTIALFAFIIDNATLLHFFQSINLFLSHFEFNASLYYIIRWIGTIITGYNIIAFAGPLLSITAGIIIFIISFSDKEISNWKLFIKALLILTVYYLFATTVHPWYICMPVVIAACTGYRYAMFWSYAVTLSYYAYHTLPVKENLWLVALSYLVTLSIAIWEIRRYSKRALF